VSYSLFVIRDRVQQQRSGLLARRATAHSRDTGGSVAGAVGAAVVWRGTGQAGVGSPVRDLPWWHLGVFLFPLSAFFYITTI
jgi:hypothetical protein